jgi:hypothetical protein
MGWNGCLRWDGMDDGMEWMLEIKVLVIQRKALNESFFPM